MLPHPTALSSFSFYLGLLATLVSLAANTATAMPPARVVPSPNGPYVGLFNIGDPLNVYDEFTAKSGGAATAPIVFTFHDWNAAGVEAVEPVLQTFNDPLEGEGNASPLQLARRVAEDGGVVAVAWDSVGYFFEHPEYFSGNGQMPITWDDVFSGRYDDYVRTVAREIKDFGGPIMLSPAGEFNSIGYFSFGPEGNQQLIDVDEEDLTRHYGDPTAPDGPERVRDLFRHVIDLFEDEGVENVTWFMYSHSGYLNPDALTELERERIDQIHPRHYYPGDEYIDWIGSSAYIDADDPTLDLAYAVDASLEAFRSITDKPYFVPEFGIVSASEADRSERLRELFLEELPEYPELQALTWADSELFAQFFTLPRLGHVEGELEAWQEAVWASGLYEDGIRTVTVPEPAPLAAALIAGSVIPPWHGRRRISVGR